MSTSAATNDIVLAFHEVRPLLRSVERRKSIDESIDKGLKFLVDDRQLDNGYISQFCISVTDTALALRGLLESGEDPDSEAIQQGSAWLKRAKFPRGGWSFTPETAPHNDAEDSGFCMAVLSVTDSEYARKQAHFLIEEQSRDGGWAPFSKDLGPFYMKYYEYKEKDLAHHASGTYFIDPSVPEISAHALTGLGKVGYTTDDQVVRDAERYFQRVQFDDGKWYAAWWTGYVYGTASVLSGLHDVGADLDRPYVRRAVDWLKRAQNPDGGWGESYRAIRDPEQAGIGASDAMRTSLAIIGLLDAGVAPDSPVLKRGIEFLMRTQASDGSWTDEHQLAMYGAPYTNPVVSNAYALWALSAYRQERQQAEDAR